MSPLNLSSTFFHQFIIIKICIFDCMLSKFIDHCYHCWFLYQQSCLSQYSMMDLHHVVFPIRASIDFHIFWKSNQIEDRNQLMIGRWERRWYGFSWKTRFETHQNSLTTESMHILGYKQRIGLESEASQYLSISVLSSPFWVGNLDFWYK